MASLDLAREGRDALTESLRGLDAIRSTALGHAANGAADKPYLSILAHSYGATAALLALQENDVTVDALAMVGSPGSPAESVGQLKVRDGNVWVADASWDPVSSTGVFGSQPLSPEYGAHHFGVDGAVDPMTGALARRVGRPRGLLHERQRVVPQHGADRHRPRRLRARPAWRRRRRAPRAGLRPLSSRPPPWPVTNS